MGVPKQELGNQRDIDNTPSPYPSPPMGARGQEGDHGCNSRSP